MEDIVLDMLQPDHVRSAGFRRRDRHRREYYPVPWSLLDYDADKVATSFPLNKDQIKIAAAYDLKNPIKHDESLGSIRERTQLLQRKSRLAIAQRG